MKAAIYNPYMDTLGGGERYTLFFAKALNELGFKVYLQWKDKNILVKAENKFGSPFSFINLLDDVKRGDGYDLIFWVSDGSVPALKSRKNLLHFQIPFKDVNGSSLLNKMKILRISKVICNSYFTKKVIDDEYKVNSSVIYPPIDIKNLKPLKNENIILYVGRFSTLMQSKRQDVLIDVFKKLYERDKRWKLVVAGGTDVGGVGYVNRLKNKSKGFPINILENPSYKNLQSLYGRAKFFWSAAGYDVDEKKDPKKMEHFGMSLVEAMAAGCVPVVYKGGGHLEVVSDGKNGKTWLKRSELIRETIGLIEDKNKYKTFSLNAIKSSRVFSYERFKEEIKDLLA